ncbi:FK506-binding protein 15-like isoform X1, partial [Clarias magur]
MKEIKDIFPDYHDGEFLAPKSGAKLASLFDPSHAEPEGNESFKFTAPKQPKKVPSAFGPHPQQQALPPPAPVVLLAFAVHAFHFVNGQYVKHGKLGVAILGNHTNKEVQPGNYTAFYDDQRQSWSLRFDSEEARIDFCKEVCVARWNSQTLTDTLLTQDLVLGEGQTVSMGDTVEVALSSWLLQNHALFDSSSCKEKLQRVSLTSNSALMGWEKGLLGMQKGGRRLIIVPRSMGYESKEVPSHAPPSSALVITVEVHQVNFSKDASRLAAGFTDCYKSLVPDLDRINVEGSVQSALGSSEQGDQGPGVKCRAVNELPKPPEADKAKLISRVAKMGQPTLPFLKVPAQPSDSVIEERRETLSVGGSSAQAVSSPLPVAVVQYPEAVSTCAAQEVHVCSDRAFQPYSASQLQPFPLTFPLQHAPYLTEIGSFMMTEARQNNTEIRLAVARVTDKVDYLASKVDDLYKQGVCSSAPSSGPLETGMILHNIQRIIQENASLKKDVLERGSRVEEHDYETEQRCVEKKNWLLDQTNDELQSKLLQAEQEKVRLAEELDASSSRVCKLQQEADDLQQRVTELHAKLSAVLQESQSCCALMSSLDSKVEELKKELVQSQQQCREEKQKCRKMEWTMTIREEEIQDLRAENESLNQLLSDRKRKWQQERERFLLQLEEQSSSNEQEQQQLLDKLRKARVYAGTHSRTQAEPEWQERCDTALNEQKLKLEEVIYQLQKQNTNLQKELESEGQQLEAQLSVQLKWVMNGLFRSLRAEFDQQKSYSGELVLNVILSTIK